MQAIVEYPNSVLRVAARRVEKFDSSVSLLIEDMFGSMASAAGVGLAAPQIGVSMSVLVMDPSAGSDLTTRYALINPRITWRSRETEIASEGCLSIPGKTCKVKRHVSVEVEYQDVTGKTYTKNFTSFEARIVQHEIDHLNGVVMTDVAVRPVKAASRESEATT